MTRRPAEIITAMLAPLTFFEARREAKATSRELIVLTSEHSRRKAAHALFSKIRQKTLAAEKRKKEFTLAQYAFEENCPKKLHDLTHEPAPFDPDSRFGFCD